MLSRESYGHPGPLGPPLDLRRVTGVDLHHTAGAFTHDVSSDLRGIAQTGVNKFGRSSYNYAIHPRNPELVYEMQGLHIGAHNDGENSTRLGLVVLGNFQTIKPSQEVVNTIASFVQMSVDRGWSTKAHIKGHRDTDATACPGAHLYAQLPNIRGQVSQMATHSVKDHWDWDRTKPADWAEAQWSLLKDAYRVLSEHSRPGRPLTYEQFAVLVVKLRESGFFEGAHQHPQQGSTTIPEHTHKPGGVA